MIKSQRGAQTLGYAVGDIKEIAHSMTALLKGLAHTKEFTKGTMI